MAYAPGSLNLCIPRLGEGLDVGSLSYARYAYLSADPIATVIAAGYIDDGNDKGLRVNDVVEVVDSNVPSVDVCLVTVVDAAGDVTMIQLA
jgi:hypothetical protein